MKTELKLQAGESVYALISPDRDQVILCDAAGVNPFEDRYSGWMAVKCGTALSPVRIGLCPENYMSSKLIDILYR